MEDLVSKNDKYENQEKQSENDVKKEEQPGKHDILLLISCLGLGILFNILFYDKSLGISYPIFILSFYAVFLYSQKKKLVFEYSFGWLLSIPIVMLSLTYLIFSNEIFMVLNFIGIPILIIAQTILLTKSNKSKWFEAYFIDDILYGIFARTFSYIPKPFKIFKLIIFKKSGPGKSSTLYKVLTGLLISLPLVLILLFLLSSADQVFGNLVGDITYFIENINLIEFIIRFILSLIIGTVAFSYIWSFIIPQKERTAINNLKKKGPVSIWDPVIVITVLISINLIYVLFTSIQFAYLFGGVVPDGFTYSEYARRGFFELNLVTLINLVILISNINLKKDGTKVINLTTKLLNSLLVACTAIMVISAHYRMFLYEEAYGFTYLRVLTHAFMGFIFVLLIIALVKVWNEKIALLKAYIITALIAYVFINYINIDVIIAKNNMLRYETTKKVDAYYLTQLSYDAVPLILPLLNEHSENISKDIRNGLYMKKDQLEYNKSWQAFNISKYKAEKLLQNIK